MIAAGIGCRKGVGADAVLAAVDGALAAHALERKSLGMLCTSAAKAGEAGLREAAAMLGLTLLEAADAELNAVGGRLLTRSARSLDATGVPSLSEAAALVAAGEGGKLLGARIAVGPVTCALAAGGATP